MIVNAVGGPAYWKIREFNSIVETLSGKHQYHRVHTLSNRLACFNWSASAPDRLMAAAAMRQ